MTSCTSPIPHDALVDLHAGELDEAEAARLEEHLFGCDACAAAWERVAAIVGGLREAVPPVVSRAHRDRLAAAGVRIRETRVEPGVDARAVFSRDVDLLIHVLLGDLGRADRVDMEIVDREGATQVLVEHVPFDRAAGEVRIVCQRHFREGFPPDLLFRLHAVEAGVRRRVGDYVIAHVGE